LRVFVRRGLLPGNAARAMGQWAHGGGFSVDGSVRIEAADRAGRERLLRYCARLPARARPPWPQRPRQSKTTSVRSSPLPPKIHACPTSPTPPQSGSRD